MKHRGRIKKLEYTLGVEDFKVVVSEKIDNGNLLVTSLHGEKVCIEHTPEEYEKLEGLKLEMDWGGIPLTVEEVERMKEEHNLKGDK